MKKVFISHSSKDKPFVRKLKEDLNFNGIETWFDQDELNVGDNLFDNLMLGLGNASHFIIVLSNNIVGSKWVDMELKEAVAAINKDVLKKIIPVLLHKTEIPKEISGLLRADFSTIVFTLKGDKVDFQDDKYHTELSKIVKAINENENFALTTKEKDELIDNTEKVSESNTKLTRITAFFEIVGFANIESRINHVRKLKIKYPNSPISKIPEKNIVPVILPIMLKQLFSKIEIGDIILFPSGGKENLVGHFCGFSKINRRIVIPNNIRKPFGIVSRDVVLLRVDGEQKEIKIID
jgi:hypothetical protein